MLRYCLTLLCTVAISAALLVGMAGCQSSSGPEQPARKVQISPSEPFLSQTQAQQRKAMIRQVSYDVYFDLTNSDAPEYTGRVAIHLDMHSVNKPLAIDFQQGQIHRLLVNGTSQTPDYNNQFLTLPRNLLATGENTVEIEFSHPFSENNSGLATYTDPEDKLRYLYTQPGLYATSQILPVFDQPDIKASYKLTVKAPAQWQVVTQSRKRQAIGGGPERWWYFPETRAISPHAFSLFAGPFKTWRHEQDQIPVRLLVRQSFGHEQAPQTLFTSIDHALNYYQQYFEQAYPYFKYDMIALPVNGVNTDLISANVVLNEQNLLPQHSADLPETIQHLLEHLAHSWIGGSVSPEWWSDQWLWNGLARYLSYQAMAHPDGKNSVNSWSMFNTRVKQPAYLYDQLPAAQPLRHDVSLNIQATRNLDIRTSKAAAILQQLHHQLGDDAFRLALQQLMQQYADRSTGAQTFFNLIQTTSGQSLKNWQKQWLDTTGVPTLTASYQCKKGILNSLTIQQAEARKRSQSVNIGLFRNKQTSLQRYRTLPVVLDSKTTQVDIPGQQPCPDFVYPNVDDKGYAQVRLNDESLTTVLKLSFNDVLMQTLMDYPIYQQPANLQATIKYATTRLPQEDNSHRLKSQLSELTQLADQLFRLRSANPSMQAASTHWLQALEELAWQQLNIAEPDSPQQNLWFDFFIHMAHSDDSAMQLKRLLQGHWEIDGLTITPYRRWTILIRLNAFTSKAAKGSWELARREYHKDPSATATIMYAMADAIRPDSLIKNQWLNRLDQLNAQEALAISRVLLPATQYSLVPALRQSVFAALRSNEPEVPSNTLDQMIKHLLNECSVNGVQQLQSFSTQKAMAHHRISIETQLQQAKHCLQLPKSAVLK
ncbi:hypothetical protein GZ77_08530 [Endozoicomonas montiporae]|uniref:Aminopeptidase N n=2 Tax=Endozoicomonas montiporae TaxID=1027273 RepID=A0A081N7J0_9GAMM|nr:M1 family aminopeptidase [Endozoicomonas montiporae]AMO55745.1 aminopeptidase N [Endozoicomonas montiporae CL-33]KEQ14413.1 hypothetical protein GZ77_08530 [Endozoicomonas montiporae]